MTPPDLIPSLSAVGLAPPALVLDVGCGTGLQARALARAGFRVVGADFDIDAVETARAWDADDERSAARRPSYCAARAEALPLGDASFDAVLCLDVLHWAADEAEFRAMWSEAWRALKPGGVFVARCLTREECPDARPAAEDGWFRLAGGAEWFLPSRALLDDALAHGVGLWVRAPEPADTPGAARFIARKPG